MAKLNNYLGPIQEVRMIDPFRFRLGHTVTYVDPDLAILRRGIITELIVNIKPEGSLIIWGITPVSVDEATAVYVVDCEVLGKESYEIQYHGGRSKPAGGNDGSNI